MLPSEQLLDDLAGAVLDGGDVDWTTAESSADADIRPLVQHMRLVASVAEVHRQALPGDGETWGHLQLLERVGQGAFGEVFRAWDTRLDREVALKLLPASPDPDRGGVIIREGRLLARVRHPNVVTIHGAERIGERVGLWMEFVHGRTLEDLLKSGRAFTPDEVAHIGVEIARAVAAVHAAGLLHRDVKAQNVMQADDGRIVLMDFGTGRELDDDGQALAGTPLYLAPELFSVGAATAASDVYSLGVLLFHLLTGSYPVREATLGELHRAHRGRPPHEDPCRTDKCAVRTRARHRPRAGSAARAPVSDSGRARGGPAGVDARDASTPGRAGRHCGNARCLGDMARLAGSAAGHRRSGVSELEHRPRERGGGRGPDERKSSAAWRRSTD